MAWLPTGSFKMSRNSRRARRRERHVHSPQASVRSLSIGASEHRARHGVRGVAGCPQAPQDSSGQGRMDQEARARLLAEDGLVPALLRKWRTPLLHIHERDPGPRLEAFDLFADVLSRTPQGRALARRWLGPSAREVTDALIPVEPMLQPVGGMAFYSPRYATRHSRRGFLHRNGDYCLSEKNTGFRAARGVMQ